MTIFRRALEAAAFWDQAVCVECESFFTADIEADSCPLCDSEKIVDASFALEIIDAVAEEE